MPLFNGINGEVREITSNKCGVNGEVREITIYLGGIDSEVRELSSSSLAIMKDRVMNPDISYTCCYEGYRRYTYSGGGSSASYYAYENQTSYANVTSSGIVLSGYYSSSDSFNTGYVKFNNIDITKYSKITIKSTSNYYYVFGRFNTGYETNYAPSQRGTSYVYAKGDFNNEITAFKNAQGISTLYIMTDSSRYGCTITDIILS